MGQSLTDIFTAQSTEDSVSFVTQVIAKFEEPRPTNAELAAYIVSALVPTAAYFSQAIAHVVDFYLTDEKKKQRDEIVQLFTLINEENAKNIMTYVYEALHNVPFGIKSGYALISF